MKKLCIVLALLLCLLPVLSVHAEEEVHPDRLIDAAGLLTEEEQLALSAHLDEISVNLNFDVAIVTVPSLEGSTAQAYADDLYDYNGYGMNGNDGILLLVCVGDEGRAYAYTTTGIGEQVFGDRAMDRLDEAFLPSLKALDYNDAFWKFADTCSDTVYYALYSEDGADAMDDDGGSFLPGLGWILLAVAIGIVLAFLVMSGYKAALKTVRSQAAANSYIRRDSLQLTTDKDIFLYSAVTSTPKADDHDSNSSSHTGSSGTSHGGRSGSF